LGKKSAIRPRSTRASRSENVKEESTRDIGRGETRGGIEGLYHQRKLRGFVRLGGGEGSGPKKQSYRPPRKVGEGNDLS